MVVIKSNASVGFRTSDVPRDKARSEALTSRSASSLKALEVFFFGGGELYFRTVGFGPFKRDKNLHTLTSTWFDIPTSFLCF